MITIETQSLLTYIALGLAIIAIIVGVIIIIANYEDLDRAMIGVALGGIGLITLLSTYSEHLVNQERTAAEEMIANGANVYIDGEEVDIDKIILDDYEITIKNDYIILSKKDVK